MAAQQQVVRVKVPQGATVGSTMQATLPNGQQVKVQLPPGVVPGQVISIAVQPSPQAASNVQAMRAAGGGMMQVPVRVADPVGGAAPEEGASPPASTAGAIAGTDLTAEQRAALDAFAAMDADGDGELTADEIYQALSKNDADVILARVQEIVAKADADGNGTVSRQEYLDAVAADIVPGSWLGGLGRRLGALFALGAAAVVGGPGGEAALSAMPDFGVGDAEATAALNAAKQGASDAPDSFLSAAETLTAALGSAADWGRDLASSYMVDVHELADLVAAAGGAVASLFDWNLVEVVRDFAQLVGLLFSTFLSLKKKPFGYLVTLANFDISYSVPSIDMGTILIPLVVCASIAILAFICINIKIAATHQPDNWVHAGVLDVLYDGVQAAGAGAQPPPGGGGARVAPLPL